MDIKQMAEHLWPCWTLGVIMLACVWNSKHRDMLRVDISGLKKFSIWLVVLTLIRFLLFKYLAPHDMIDQVKGISALIPWQCTFGVFWEDAVHSMPLVLLGRMFDKEKWYSYIKWPALILVMASFGSGHMYQGLISAIALSFYIPYAMSMGKKYGFGTVMIAHILYDLLTLLSFKWMVGA